MSSLIGGLLPIPSVVGWLVLGIGVTSTAYEIKFKNAVTPEVKSEIEDWYDEIYQDQTNDDESTETTAEEQDDQDGLFDTITGKFLQEKPNNKHDNPQKKLKAIKSQHGNQVNTNPDHGDLSPNIIDAINQISNSASPHDDSVGELKKVLADESVNKDTVIEKFDTIFNYARVAEFYKNKYKPGMKRFEAKSIDENYEEDHEMVEFLNGLTTNIYNLKEQKKSLQNDRDRLKKEKEKIENQLLQEKTEKEDLLSTIDNAVAKIDKYIYGTHTYNNKENADKLSSVSEQVERGNVKNASLETTLEVLRTETDVTNFGLTSDLLEILDKINQGEPMQDEAKEVFRNIADADRIFNRIGNVDIEQVRSDAEDLRVRAKGQSGIAPNEIEHQLESGKVHTIIHEQNDKELIFAFSYVLDFYEQILDTINNEKELDASTVKLKEYIHDKQSNFNYYKNNNPGYNHLIPEMIDERLEEELGEATDMAANGMTDEANGRLAMIQVGYELIENMYTQQNYQSVLDSAD